MSTLHRDKRYSLLTDDDVAFFRSIDDAMVITDKDAVASYSVDWLKKYGSTQTRLVLRPNSTEQVSSILKYCYERKLAVVPQGGNTGLVGGSVPIFDELIISMQRMNKVLHVDESTSTVLTEAGVILENLESELNKSNLTSPIDLGAKGSCHIGGNVATNAGGVHLLRYGNLHGNVLGLECVLANGEILDLLSPLRKDNTGYDLKQLFIGSEGTLGIITKVILNCPPRPSSRSLAFLACNSFDDVRNMLKIAKQELGEVLSAFEMLDGKTVEICKQYCIGVSNPLAQSAPFFVLVEVAGSNEEHNSEKLTKFCERVLGEEVATDGTVAQDMTQLKQIWKLRESAAEGIMHIPSTIPCKYDISLPLDNYYEIVEIMADRVGGDGIALGYGHVGDNNLHLNVAVKNKEAQEKVESFLWQYCKDKRGSISAEHGVGLQKVDKLHYAKSPQALELMKATKKMLDPNLILNPFKVIKMD